MTSEEQTSLLRKQLTELLRGGSAHLDIAAVFDGVRDEDWGASAEHAPHTLWQLLEHTRFTLHDLLVFSTDANYRAPKWPEQYWPGEASPATAKEAAAALRALEADTTAMIALVENPATDLLARIPWGDGQTILREVLLAADHTSYHLGQAMFLRKLLEG